MKELFSIEIDSGWLPFFNARSLQMNEDVATHSHSNGSKMLRPILSIFRYSCTYLCLCERPLKSLNCKLPLRKIDDDKKSEACSRRPNRRGGRSLRVAINWASCFKWTAKLQTTNGGHNKIAALRPKLKRIRLATRLSLPLVCIRFRSIWRRKSTQWRRSICTGLASKTTCAILAPKLIFALDFETIGQTSSKLANWTNQELQSCPLSS